MKTKTETDLKELKDLLNSNFTQLKAENAQISQQLRDLELGQVRIIEKLNSMEQKIELEVKRLDDRLDTYQTAIQKIPDLAE